MARKISLWQGRSASCAARRGVRGSKVLFSIFAFCTPISAGLHASEQDGPLPQDGEVRQVSAEALNADEEMQVDPLSFEAFDARAREEAAARVINGPPTYLTLEDAKSSTGGNVMREGPGSGSVNSTASSGPDDASAE